MKLFPCFIVILLHFISACLEFVNLSSAVQQTTKHLAAAVTSHMLIRYNGRKSFGLGQ